MTKFDFRDLHYQLVVFTLLFITLLLFLLKPVHAQIVEKPLPFMEESPFCVGNVFLPQCSPGGGKLTWIKFENVRKSDGVTEVSIVIEAVEPVRPSAEDAIRLREFAMDVCLEAAKSSTIIKIELDDEKMCLALAIAGAYRANANYILEKYIDEIGVIPVGRLSPIELDDLEDAAAEFAADIIDILKGDFKKAKEKGDSIKDFVDEVSSIVNEISEPHEKAKYAEFLYGLYRQALAISAANTINYQVVLVEEVSKGKLIVASEPIVVGHSQRESLPVKIEANKVYQVWGRAFVPRNDGARIYSLWVKSGRDISTSQ